MPTNSLADETGPLKGTIPPAWPGVPAGPGITPPVVDVKEARITPPAAAAGGCVTYTVYRTFQGEVRDGAVFPVGPGVICAFYMGGCVWQITRLVPGMKNRYRLVKVSVDLVTECDGKKMYAEQSASAPAWIKLGPVRALYKQEVVETVKTPPPCAEFWAWSAPLPDDVWSSVQKQAAANGAGACPRGIGPEPPPTDPSQPTVEAPMGADAGGRLPEDPEHPHDPNEQEENERLERYLYRLRIEDDTVDVMSPGD